MIRTVYKNRHSLPIRAIAALMSLSFVFSAIVPPPAYAQRMITLPAPGMMVTVSPPFTPVLIRGVKINRDNPFQFDFIVDSGETGIEDQALRDESQKLIKYFLAALTVPEEDLWVNLSPYERNKIIPQEFGTTEMGRDMLAQDYMLKQLTASLIYPEKELGQKFWESVYKKAYDRYGTTEIAVNTFNKVWIIPESAAVEEIGDTAFITGAKLKVLMEEDYLALNQNINKEERGTDELTSIEIKKISNLSASVVKELIIPEIEKEINKGENFAPLRQIYHSLILAAWYKRTLKESLLSQVYVDQNKIAGVDLLDKDAKDKIYEKYLEAYKQGVYNYIKEDYDENTGQVLPRKYFSGGAKFTLKNRKTGQDNLAVTKRTGSPSIINRSLKRIASGFLGTMLMINAAFAESVPAQTRVDVPPPPIVLVKASDAAIEGKKDRKGLGKKVATAALGLGLATGAAVLLADSGEPTDVDTATPVIIEKDEEDAKITAERVKRGVQTQEDQTMKREVVKVAPDPTKVISHDDLDQLMEKFLTTNKKFNRSINLEDIQLLIDTQTSLDRIRRIERHIRKPIFEWQIERDKKLLKEERIKYIDFLIKLKPVEKRLLYFQYTKPILPSKEVLLKLKADQAIEGDEAKPVLSAPEIHTINLAKSILTSMNNSATTITDSDGVVYDIWTRIDEDLTELSEGVYLETVLSPQGETLNGKSVEEGVLLLYLENGAVVNSSIKLDIVNFTTADGEFYDQRDLSGKRLGSQIFDIYMDSVPNGTVIESEIVNKLARQELTKNYFVDNDNEVYSKVDGKRVVDKSEAQVETEGKSDEQISIETVFKLTKISSLTKDKGLTQFQFKYRISDVTEFAGVAGLRGFLQDAQKRKKDLPSFWISQVKDQAMTGRQKTILVVDDEKGIREGNAMLLQLKGYRVLEARDGQEAWDIIEKQGDEIDFVYTDLEMPNMNGDELIARINTKFPGKPIVFYSAAEEMAQDAIRAKKLKITEFFLKGSVSPVDIIDYINGFLKGPIDEAIEATKAKEIVDRALNNKLLAARVEIDESRRLWIGPKRIKDGIPFTRLKILIDNQPRQTTFFDLNLKTGLLTPTNTKQGKVQDLSSNIDGDDIIIRLGAETIRINPQNPLAPTARQVGYLVTAEENFKDKNPLAFNYAFKFDGEEVKVLDMSGVWETDSEGNAVIAIDSISVDYLVNSMGLPENLTGLGIFSNLLETIYEITPPTVGVQIDIVTEPTTVRALSEQWDKITDNKQWSDVTREFPDMAKWIKEASDNPLPFVKEKFGEERRDDYLAFKSAFEEALYQTAFGRALINAGYKRLSLSDVRDSNSNETASISIIAKRDQAMTALDNRLKQSDLPFGVWKGTIKKTETQYSVRTITRSREIKSTVARWFREGKSDSFDERLVNKTLETIRKDSGFLVTIESDEGELLGLGYYKKGQHSFPEVDNSANLISREVYLGGNFTEVLKPFRSFGLGEVIIAKAVDHILSRQSFEQLESLYVEESFEKGGDLLVVHPREDTDAVSRFFNRIGFKKLNYAWEAILDEEDRKKALYMSLGVTQAEKLVESVKGEMDQAMTGKEDYPPIIQEYVEAVGTILPIGPFFDPEETPVRSIEANNTLDYLERAKYASMRFFEVSERPDFPQFPEAQLSTFRLGRTIIMDAIFLKLIDVIAQEGDAWNPSAMYGKDFDDLNRAQLHIKDMIDLIDQGEYEGEYDRDELRTWRREIIVIGMVASIMDRVAPRQGDKQTGERVWDDEAVSEDLRLVIRAIDVYEDVVGFPGPTKGYAGYRTTAREMLKFRGEDYAIEGVSPQLLEKSSKFADLLRKRKDIVKTLVASGEPITTIKKALFENKFDDGEGIVDLQEVINEIRRAHGSGSLDQLSFKFADTHFDVPTLLAVSQEREGDENIERALNVLFDYYLLHQLANLSVSVFDEGDPNENLDELDRLLDQLQGGGGSNSRFISKAATLLLLATSEQTPSEVSYRNLLIKVRENLNSEHQLNFAISTTGALSPHLRFGYEIDNVIEYDGQRFNFVDYVWLLTNLNILLKEYETVKGKPESDPKRQEIVEAILNALAADPEFFSSFDREAAVEYVEQNDSYGERYLDDDFKGDWENFTLGLGEEFRTLFDRHRIDLAKEMRVFDPDQQPFSVLNINITFPSLVFMFMALRSIQSDEFDSISFEDLSSAVNKDEKDLNEKKDQYVKELERIGFAYNEAALKVRPMMNNAEKWGSHVKHDKALAKKAFDSVMSVMDQAMNAEQRLELWNAYYAAIEKVMPRIKRDGSESRTYNGGASDQEFRDAWTAILAIKEAEGALDPLLRRQQEIIEGVMTQRQKDEAMESKQKQAENAEIVIKQTGEYFQGRQEAGTLSVPWELEEVDPDFGDNIHFDPRDRSFWIHVQNTEVPAFDASLRINVADDDSISYDRMIIESGEGFVEVDNLVNKNYLTDSGRTTLYNDILPVVTPFNDRIREVVQDPDFDPTYIMGTWQDENGENVIYQIFLERTDLSQADADGIIEKKVGTTMDGGLTLPFKVTDQAITGEDALLKKLESLVTQEGDLSIEFYKIAKDILDLEINSRSGKLKIVVLNALEQKIQILDELISNFQVLDFTKERYEEFLKEIKRSFGDIKADNDPRSALRTLLQSAVSIFGKFYGRDFKDNDWRDITHKSDVQRMITNIHSYSADIVLLSNVLDDLILIEKGLGEENVLAGVVRNLDINKNIRVYIKRKKDDFEGNISLDLDESLPKVVGLRWGLGIKYHLGFVISELINNAVDYGKDEIKVQTTKEDKNLVITIENKGKLKSRSDENIFNWYRPKEGAGVGLALSRLIVGIHQGELTVAQTKDERGEDIVRVQMTLPLIDDPAMTGKKKSRLKITSSGTTEEVIDKLRTRTSAPIKNGTGWLRIVATPDEAREFHTSWTPSAKGTSSVVFNNQEYRVSNDSLNKMEQWSFGNPDHERLGYFVAQRQDDFIQILDFVPVGSVAGDPAASSAKADKDATQVTHLVSEHFNIPEIAKAFGINLASDQEQRLDSLKKAKQFPEDTFGIRVHSHHLTSNYPKGPSEADQELDDNRVEVVFPLKLKRAVFFDNQSITEVAYDKKVDDQAMTAVAFNMTNWKKTFKGRIGRSANPYRAAGRTWENWENELKKLVGITPGEVDFNTMSDDDFIELGDYLREEWHKKGFDEHFGRFNQYLALLIHYDLPGPDEVERVRRRIDYLTRSKRKDFDDERRLALWTQGVALSMHLRNFGPHAEVFQKDDRKGQINFVDADYLVGVVKDYIPLLIKAKKSELWNERPMKQTQADQPLVDLNPLKTHSRNVKNGDLWLWGLLVMLDPMIHNYLKFKTTAGRQVDASEYVRDTYGTTENMMSVYLEKMLKGLEIIEDGKTRKIAFAEIDELLKEAFELFMKEDEDVLRDLRSPLGVYISDFSLYDVIRSSSATKKQAGTPVADQVFSMAFSKKAIYTSYSPADDHKYFPSINPNVHLGLSNYMIFTQGKWARRLSSTNRLIRDSHSKLELRTMKSEYQEMVQDEAMEGEVKAVEGFNAEFKEAAGQVEVFLDIGTDARVKSYLNKPVPDKPHVSEHVLQFTISGSEHKKVFFTKRGVGNNELEAAQKAHKAGIGPKVGEFNYDGQRQLVQYSAKGTRLDDFEIKDRSALKDVLGALGYSLGLLHRSGYVHGDLGNIHFGDADFVAENVFLYRFNGAMKSEFIDFEKAKKIYKKDVSQSKDADLERKVVESAVKNYFFPTDLPWDPNFTTLDAFLDHFDERYYAALNDQAMTGVKQRFEVVQELIQRMEKPKTTTDWNQIEREGYLGYLMAAYTDDQEKIQLAVDALMPRFSLLEVQWQTQAVTFPSLEAQIEAIDTIVLGSLRAITKENLIRDHLVQYFTLAQLVHPPPIRPEHYGQSHQVSFQMEGREVLGLAETHRDPYALDLLRGMLSQDPSFIEDALAGKWVFALESSEARLTQMDFRGTPIEVAYRVARLLNIPVIFPVRNISQRTVVEQVALEVGNRDSSINLDHIVGWLAGTTSTQLTGGDIDLAARRMAEGWEGLRTEDQIKNAYQDFGALPNAEAMRMAQLINEVLGELQDSMMEADLRDGIVQNPNAEKVLLVAGFKHVHGMEQKADQAIEGGEEFDAYIQKVAEAYYDRDALADFHGDNMRVNLEAARTDTGLVSPIDDTTRYSRYNVLQHLYRGKKGQISLHVHVNGDEKGGEPNDAGHPLMIALSRDQGNRIIVDEIFGEPGLGEGDEFASLMDLTDQNLISSVRDKSTVPFLLTEIQKILDKPQIQSVIQETFEDPSIISERNILRYPTVETPIATLVHYTFGRTKTGLSYQFARRDRGSDEAMEAEEVLANAERLKEIAKRLKRLNLRKERKPDEFDRTVELKREVDEILASSGFAVRSLFENEQTEGENFLEALITVLISKTTFLDAYSSRDTPEDNILKQFSLDFLISEPDLPWSPRVREVVINALKRKAMKNEVVKILPLLKAGLPVVTRPFKKLDDFYQLQSALGDQEISIEIFYDNRDQPYIFMQAGGDSKAEATLANTIDVFPKLNNGHTHGYQRPVEPSGSDTLNARNLMEDSGFNSFVVGFDVNGEADLAYFVPELNRWDNLFDQEQVRGKLKELGVVKSDQAIEGDIPGADKRGGIDFNPNNLDLQIKRDPEGVPIPMSPQQIEQINIQGLQPVIINITPIQNLPLILGMADTDEIPDVSYEELDPARELELVSSTD